jgi:hypothetical protein
MNTGRLLTEIVLKRPEKIEESAIIRYLNDPEDPWSTQRAARQSMIRNFDRGACDESAPQSVRTSLLPEASDFTDEGSLIALTESSSIATSRASLTSTPLQQPADITSVIQCSKVRERDPLPFQHNAFREDTSTPSECSDEKVNLPLLSDRKLVVIKAKHELLVTLMKDVYAMLGSKEEVANVRTCATSSESGPSGTFPQGSASELPTLGKDSKRRMQGRKLPREEDNDDGKRRKKTGLSLDPRHHSRRYACPFHKHNPIRYSVENSIMIRYRTCSGPGFTAISRLK